MAASFFVQTMSSKPDSKPSGGQVRLLSNTIAGEPSNPFSPVEVVDVDDDIAPAAENTKDAPKKRIGKSKLGEMGACDGADVWYDRSNGFELYLSQLLICFSMRHMYKSFLKFSELKFLLQQEQYFV